MNQQQYSDLIEQVAHSQGNNFIAILDEVKNHIADARNGDYSTEARKCAIASIDEKLYNLVKAVLNKTTKEKPEMYFDGML